MTLNFQGKDLFHSLYAQLSKYVQSNNKLKKYNYNLLFAIFLTNAILLESKMCHLLKENTFLKLFLILLNEI